MPKSWRRAFSITPAWDKYWLDPSAPHPDAGRAENRSTPPQRAFPKATGYCHHYRAADEHYHRTMEELEACLR